MRYLPDPETYPQTTFEFNYEESKKLYEEYVKLTDEEFRRRLVEILHFSMFICYVKGIRASMLLHDLGMLHLMAHQLHLPDDKESAQHFPTIRQQFDKFCQLV